MAKDKQAATPAAGGADQGAHQAHAERRAPSKDDVARAVLKAHPGLTVTRLVETKDDDGRTKRVPQKEPFSAAAVLSWREYEDRVVVVTTEGRRIELPR